MLRRCLFEGLGPDTNAITCAGVYKFCAPAMCPPSNSTFNIPESELYLNIVQRPDCVSCRILLNRGFSEPVSQTHNTNFLFTWKSSTLSSKPPRRRVARVSQEMLLRSEWFPLVRGRAKGWLKSPIRSGFTAAEGGLDTKPLSIEVVLSDVKIRFKGGLESLVGVSLNLRLFFTEPEFVFFMAGDVNSNMLSSKFKALAGRLKEVDCSVSARGAPKMKFLEEENEQADRLMVSDYRRPWTPATPEESQYSSVHWRTILPVWQCLPSILILTENTSRICQTATDKTTRSSYGGAGTKRRLPINSKNGLLQDQEDKGINFTGKTDLVKM
ncbi:hypothetical protein MSG28_016014 [Choristoneura fumiferana]|uniref:Uncharacterized protein n=1 Tax=Choristoneura fumiferana TaxID=7141 RepID=A0ACC0K4X6_CHOFU|nr:hypothetical protein MSG28_016014 [Choristoneura fumiferana]